MQHSVQFFDTTEIEDARLQSAKLYREFLRTPPMSAGLYVLAAGSVDPQKPHHEDELYYVVRGRARFKASAHDQEQDREVTAGSVIFVPAEVPHRFHNITEELTVLVFFAPAET
jgi:mannose-6-phosphate isomerase-like protein (cupin superfamily)